MLYNKHCGCFSLSGRQDTTASLGVPTVLFQRRSDGPIYKWMTGHLSGIHHHTTDAIWCV